MTHLTHIEKLQLEKHLEMGGGSVLNFSNKTFATFFREVVAIDIFSTEYDFQSGSKANRMRKFWDIATLPQLLNFLKGIQEGWEFYSQSNISEPAATVLTRIISKVQSLATPDVPDAPQDEGHSEFEKINFKVALSFPGAHREYVALVAQHLTKSLGKNAVFYDKNFQAHLARPDLDTLLLKVYRNRSELVVVFLSSNYQKSDWCGLEWRAVRDMIKTKEGDQLMFVRFDQTDIDGMMSIDGYIDASEYNESETAQFILQRVKKDV